MRSRRRKFAQVAMLIVIDCSNEFFFDDETRGNRMGHLSVFTETGTPHAGCYLEYDRAGIRPEWLGFFPLAIGWTAVLGAGGNGRVGDSDRSDQVNHYARWTVDDS